MEELLVLSVDFLVRLAVSFWPLAIGNKNTDYRLKTIFNFAFFAKPFAFFAVNSLIPNT